LGWDCTGVGKYDFCFGLRALFIAVQLSMVIGGCDNRIYQDHREMRRGDFIHTIRFLSQSFLVRWHDGLGRGHGKALRRAWDTYFCCNTFVFVFFLLCVHDG
jgi:hypothetical protein